MERRLPTSIIIIFILFPLLTQCDVSDHRPGELALIPESAKTVTFGGTTWSDVVFQHTQHSERYKGQCIKCHDHQAIAGETHWYCRSCHTAGQDSEKLCKPDQYHGRIMTQCSNCHETKGENPGMSCAGCHKGDAIRPQPTQTGSLQVTLGPSEAVSAGAQWNVDGGAWQNSGATVSSLSAGSHSVSYKSVTGWAAPSSESVQITANNTTSIGRSYAQSSEPQPFTLTFAGEITQPSQVDQNTFAIPALGSVVIDVQAWEAHQGQGRTTDFFGDGDKNNDLDSEMHLFKNGTLVGTGGKGPGANSTRSCRDPYLNTNVIPGTYMVAIGSGPLTWQDALAKNNTDGSLWSDHWYGTFNYNKYRIKVTYQPN